MNLKVLDLSRVLAGPVCTMMLGDMGADVIKVERPGQGDETRGWGPPFDPEGQSAYFLAINRNKKSVALDIGAAADRDVILDLISGADVVLDNSFSARSSGLGSTLKSFWSGIQISSGARSRDSDLRPGDPATTSWYKRNVGGWRSRGSARELR